MMATGAGVSVGLGLAGLNESQFGVGTVHAAESHVGSVSEFQPVRVELSSKGFIDTFSKLQQELAGKYPNIHHAPPQVAEILDSSPEKLAEKFGLYKPGSEFQSGFGLKGEHLAFDKSGNLIFEHIKGNQTLLDAKTGLIHEYKGTMFDAQSGKLSVKPVLEAQPVVESHASSVIDQTNTGAATISEASSESLAEAAANGALTTEIPTNVDANTKIFGFSGKDALADTATLGLSVAPDVVAKETIQTVPENLFMVDGVPTDAFSGKVSIDALISGGAPLIDKYQFDTSKEAKEARKQYAIAFEKLYMKAPDGLVDNRWRIDGSLGLQLLQTGNDLTVLLNGKKIGTGSVNQNGQVGMQYEEALGKGLFGVKNPYQLAFEKATKVAKEKVKPVNKHQ
jgi:hypothetical protein